MNAIKCNLKLPVNTQIRIEWFFAQFGYKLNNHHSINKSITCSSISKITTFIVYINALTSPRQASSDIEDTIAPIASTIVCDIRIFPLDSFMITFDTHIGKVRIVKGLSTVAEVGTNQQTLLTESNTWEVIVVRDLKPEETIIFSS